MAESRKIDRQSAERGAWRHNQEAELADWDALDLDVLTSDRELWAGSGKPGEKAGEGGGR